MHSSCSTLGNTSTDFQTVKRNNYAPTDVQLGEYFNGVSVFLFFEQVSGVQFSNLRFILHFIVSIEFALQRAQHH